MFYLYSHAILQAKNKSTTDVTSGVKRKRTGSTGEDQLQEDDNAVDMEDSTEPVGEAAATGNRIHSFIV